MAILQRKTLGKLNKRKKLNVFDHDTQCSEKRYGYHVRCKVALTVENYSLSTNLSIELLLKCLLDSLSLFQIGKFENMIYPLISFSK